MSKSCNNLESQWTARNLHVLEFHGAAEIIVKEFVSKGTPKADILLLAELMIDLVKRFD